MEELGPILLVVCPLVFLGGLIDAVSGGGGLITLPAYLIAGLPPHMAAGTNKCGNVFGTLLSTVRFLKRGEVHYPSAILSAVGALLGAWLGVRLNLIVPDRVLSSIMLIVVPVMALFLAVKKDFGEADRSGELTAGQLLARALITGIALGAYDGFFGPGAGAFMMMAFTGLCRFDLLTASGNTKVCNSASNLASMVTFAFSGKVMWTVGLPAALCGIAGNYVGSSLALKKGARLIRPMFFVVLTLLVCRLLWDGILS